MSKMHFTINKDSSITITDQLVNQITKSIFSGNLELGEKLPAERDLADELNISRGTVKKAYLKLAESNVIEIRKGSGSYVIANNHILDENQKRQAVEILSDAFYKLEAMGLSEKEILNIINLHITSSVNINKVSVMVISNNHEILINLQNQLSYLSGRYFSNFTLSYLTLDNIKAEFDPYEILLNYDLIIASVIDYPEISEMIPMMKNKIICAEISPRSRTLLKLSTLPRNSKITVIYRTDTFKNMVINTLLKIGMDPMNIFPVQELQYNPEKHSDNGVSVLINFNESPVYVNPAFTERNQQFLSEGGKIIHFEYYLDRDSLLDIEKRISSILAEKSSKSDF